MHQNLQIFMNCPSQLKQCRILKLLFMVNFRTYDLNLIKEHIVKLRPNLTSVTTAN